MITEQYNSSIPIFNKLEKNIDNEYIVNHYEDLTIENVCLGVKNLEKVESYLNDIYSEYNQIEERLEYLKYKIEDTENYIDVISRVTDIRDGVPVFENYIGMDDTDNFEHMSYILQTFSNEDKKIAKAWVNIPLSNKYNKVLWDIELTHDDNSEIIQAEEDSTIRKIKDIANLFILG